MKLTTFYGIIAFFTVSFLIYVGAVVCLIKRSRKGRHPIRKDFKLSRRPGETLIKEIEAIDERFDEEFFTGLFAPVLVAIILIVVAANLPLGNLRMPVFGLIAIAYGISLTYRVRRARDMVVDRRNHKLGLMGERVVAEELSPLVREGFYVFHDIPATGAAKDFNLDHVVVGPSGVFVIETKARRKPNAEREGDDYKVRYDGKALFWPAHPNFPDSAPVTQAANNAEWLRLWIYKQLNLRVPVTPILVAPGWFADRKGKSDVRFVNGTELPNVIRGPQTLDENTIDLIQRQLASLCRDISTEA